MAILQRWCYMLVVYPMRSNLSFSRSLWTLVCNYRFLALYHFFSVAGERLSYPCRTSSQNHQMLQLLSSFQAYGLDLCHHCLWPLLSELSPVNCSILSLGPCLINIVKSTALFAATVHMGLFLDHLELHAYWNQDPYCSLLARVLGFNLANMNPLCSLCFFAIAFD